MVAITNPFNSSKPFLLATNSLLRVIQTEFVAAEYCTGRMNFAGQLPSALIKQILAVRSNPPLIFVSAGFSSWGWLLSNGRQLPSQKKASRS
ncbi:hypothetical protein [Microcoleus anatoxicus]|uniref:Uncharacterized protein n=1 Tax=Microcoleus anatoxicus PTRS2 TaxID=2705321 RepID=A0ABU8YP82_9CYAN